MRLTACTCRAEHYRRRARAWWMKPIFTRRLYRCYSCDAMLLISPNAVSHRLGHHGNDAFAPTDLLYREPVARPAPRRQKPA